MQIQYYFLCCVENKSDYLAKEYHFNYAALWSGKVDMLSVEIGMLTGPMQELRGCFSNLLGVDDTLIYKSLYRFKSYCNGPENPSLAYFEEADGESFYTVSHTQFQIHEYL